jgi:hypothetical protein
MDSIVKTFTRKRQYIEITSDYIKTSQIIEQVNIIRTRPNKRIKMSNAIVATNDNDYIPKEPDNDEKEQFYKKVTDELKVLKNGTPDQKGNYLEELVKETLDNKQMQTTITKASKWNKIPQGGFEKIIFGDYGKDLEGQIKIKGQIRNVKFQCKNWYTKPITGDIVRSMESQLARQPDYIGIIVIQDGGIDNRARNVVQNSPFNLYVYHAKDIINIVYDLHHIEFKTQGIKRTRVSFEEAEDATFINHEIYQVKKIRNYICETIE